MRIADMIHDRFRTLSAAYARPGLYYVLDEVKEIPAALAFTTRLRPFILGYEKPEYSVRIVWSKADDERAGNAEQCGALVRNAFQCVIENLETPRG